MSKFLLHRLERMVENSAEEKITPGLKAAACLHSITCHERDPKQFAASERQMAEWRQQLADYLKAAAGETAAYLQLKTTQHEKNLAATGTKDNQAGPAPEAATEGRRVGAQIGWNWVLLYWEEPKTGSRPWGYRVYRTDKKSPPVLVATVVETEALLPDQPERVKWYYYVKAFNGAGESEQSGDFGMMFNAPEEPETNGASSGGKKASLPFPAHELPIRRELGAAMLTFTKKTMEYMFARGEGDEVMRQVATEEYRQAVLKAARQNVENSLAWHTLATWTEDGKERIGNFSRALECCRMEAKANPPKTPQEIWSSVHTQADCLFEIGRVHFHEGAPDVARQFLNEALPLAREAEALQAKAGAQDDRLEGRIAELLLQLPDENEA